MKHGCFVHVGRRYERTVQTSLRSYSDHLTTISLVTAIENIYLLSCFPCTYAYDYGR
jgi:hypothetical protein